jgi:hypothetical protein
MKIPKLAYMALALLAFTGAAMADPIDPAVGVDGGSGSVSFFGTAMGTCVTNPCDIHLPSATIFFDNRTGAPIGSFDFKWDQLQPGNDIFPDNFSVIRGSLFTVLEVISRTEVRLSGAPGVFIPPCTGEFCAPENTFRLNILGMNGMVTITSAAPVPEPGTLLLLSTGLGCVGLIRRRRNKAAD